MQLELELQLLLLPVVAGLLLLFPVPGLLLLLPVPVVSGLFPVPVLVPVVLEPFAVELLPRAEVELLVLVMVDRWKWSSNLRKLLMYVLVGFFHPFPCLCCK